jgi:hypothetical protein
MPPPGGWECPVGAGWAAVVRSDAAARRLESVPASGLGGGS